jgi:hypothetical protein
MVPSFRVYNMSKLINEQIQVHPDKSLKITAFIWRKRLYRVLDFLSWWRAPADWWNDGEGIRFFVRVSAKHSSTGTYELCKAGREWYLHRVLD